MVFPIKLFTIRGNLVFMSSFSHKIAVASIGIALSFASGASKEAKAATFFLTDTAEFFITLTFNPSGEGGHIEFTNHMGHSFLVRNSRISAFEYENRRGFYEFSISNFSRVNRAIFSIRSDDWDPNHYHSSLETFAYIGNGQADLSDFYGGPSLGIQRSRYPDRIDFDVTQFAQERVNNRDAFVGFAISALYQGSANINRTYYRPVLIVEGEPVPEPTTIFGSALALGVGGWLKRKKSSQHNKITSQRYFII